MWHFVQGTTFRVAGSFQLDGASTDMTNWAVNAAIHDAAGETLIANLTATFLDAANGVVQLTAGSTSAWPAGKARIDVAVRDPQGNQYVSTPDYFRIIDTPLPV